MSYEGYSQFLCRNGHYWKVDALGMMFDSEKQQCPICWEDEVFENMVDVTNGSFDEETGERIDGYINLKIKSENSGTCSNCGEKHICEITYQIPEDEE